MFWFCGSGFGFWSGWSAKAIVMVGLFCIYSVIGVLVPCVVSEVVVKNCFGLGGVPLWLL